MLKPRHLLGIADLETEEIGLLRDTADAMTEIAARPIKKVPTLRGRTVVNLFFEPSTRTRMSFEVAEKRLSADTLSIAVAQSSVFMGPPETKTPLSGHHSSERGRNAMRPQGFNGSLRWAMVVGTAQQRTAHCPSGGRGVKRATTLSGSAPCACRRSPPRG